MPSPRGPRQREALGSALLEALVAAAISLMVITSLLTAFVHGARGLRAAAALTRATALAQSVQEDLQGGSWRSTWTVLEDDADGTTLSHACWDSRGAGQGACSVQHEPAHADYQRVLTAWRDAAAELPEGSLTVTVRGLGAVVDDGALEVPLGRATILQVAVSVRWSEGARQRSVLLLALRT